MKTKKLLLLLSAMGLLVSCGENPSESTSSTGGTPDSSGTPEEPPAPVDTEALINGVIAGLNEAANATSLTVNYVEKDSSGKDTQLTDIYTPDYISYGWSNSGYVLLDSFNKNLGDKLVYSFEYDQNGNIVLGKAATYVDDDNVTRGVNSCSDMNFLKSLLKGNQNFNHGLGLTKASFYYRAGAVHTDDEELLDVMCSFMGYQYGDSETRIADVTFYVDEKGTLSFSLYYQPDEDSAATSILLTASVGNFNNTSDEKLANYVKDYRLPTDRISDATKEILNAPTIGFDTEIRYRTATSSWTSYGKTGVNSYIDRENRDNDKIVYSLEDKGNNETYNYVLTKGEKNEKGLVPAIDHYINGKNEEATQEFEKKDFTWGNGIFSFQDEIDADSFLGENNSYSYFGFNTDRLFESIAGLTVLTDIIIRDVTSLSFVVNADNTLTFRTNINAYYADAEGTETELMLLAISTVKKDLGEIKLPTPYADESEENQKLNYAIDHLKDVDWEANGYGLSDKAGQTDQPSPDLPKTNYYYKKDSYFIQDWAKRSLFSKDGKTYERQGYKKVEGGIIPFRVTRKANDQGTIPPGKAVATVQEIDTVDKLENHFGFTFSSKVFKPGENPNTFVLRDNVKQISGDILGNAKVDYLVDTSLVITLDSQNRLSKIYYKYVYASVLGGREEISFKYYDGDEEMKFPEKVVDKDSFDSLSVDLPTNWLEEDKVNAIMTKTFGEEVAKLIPYLPQFEVSNAWDTTPLYDGSGDICIYNTHIDDDYVASYKDLLVKSGYVIKQIGKLSYYVKDYEAKATKEDIYGAVTEFDAVYTVRIRFGEKKSESNPYDTSDDFYLGCTITPKASA